MSGGSRRAGLGGVGGSGGTMLIKSVSLFLASGRRASANIAALRNAAERADAATVKPGTKGKKRDRKNMANENSKAGSNKCSAKMMEQLRKSTHFTRQEIESLCRVYRKLLSTNSFNFIAPGGGGGGGAGAATNPPPVSVPGIAAAATFNSEGLDRVVFRELIHNTFDLVTEEVLMDRIFCAFDRYNDGVIGLEEWVTGLSVFLKGTHEEKTAFCYHVYDLNSDGFITREEMLHLLRNCLVKHPQDEDPDEGVKDLVELALRKLDYDKDGKISFQDFQVAVKEEPLLLEAFGQCLPSETACQTFMSTL